MIAVIEFTESVHVVHDIRAAVRFALASGLGLVIEWRDEGVRETVHGDELRDAWDAYDMGCWFDVVGVA